MELKFKKELNRTEDISLSGFTEKVDKEYDYPNIISVVIDWRAIIYYRDSGITDIYPIIDKVTLFMDYAYQDLENDNISGDREYNLVIDDFELTNSFERDSKSYEDRKWISNDEKSSDRDETDTYLFPTYIDIDFETKTINVEF